MVANLAFIKVNEMIAIEILKSYSQIEYERLLNGLAGALQTQRRFIKILSCESVNPFVMRFTVKRKGDYYPYLIEEITNLKSRRLYLILGVVI